MRSCRCAPARVGNHSHRHRIAGNPRGPASFPSVRDISCDDGPAKPGVALISASLARAVFPPGNEIGPAHPDRRARSSRGRSDRRYRRCALRQAGRPDAARRLPADHAGNGTDLVSDRVCPRDRRPRDGARGLYTRHRVTRASVVARIHHFVGIGARATPHAVLRAEPASTRDAPEAATRRALWRGGWPRLTAAYGDRRGRCRRVARVPAARQPTRAGRR